MQKGTVQLERKYPVTAPIIWEALTVPEKMKQWYFDLPGFRAEIGYEFSFLAGQMGKPYLHHCLVTSVIPGIKLSYSWRNEGYEGNSEVSFELPLLANLTLLRITHTGLKFPRPQPGPGTR